MSPESESRPTIKITCAGFTRRALATSLDMCIFALLSAPLAWPLNRGVDWSRAITGYNEFIAALTAPEWSSHAAAVLGLWVALWWSYFVVGWGLLGATPGKWLCRLRVVDHQGRCPIGPTRAVMRLVAYGISSISLGAGHALILLRRDHRALHDVLAGTRVISTTARMACRTRNGE